MCFKKLKEKLIEKEKELEMKGSEVCLLWSVCFSPAMFGGFGGLMMIAGAMVGTCGLCTCKKFCGDKFDCLGGDNDCKFEPWDL